MTQSPQKKVRGTESEEPTKGKMAENSRRLSMKDSCGVVERTTFTEDELHAVPLELCEKWDSVEENAEAKKWEILATNSNTTVRALHGLIRNKRPSMIFLSKTKMKDHRLDGVRRRMGFVNGFNVPHIGRAGCISLWWDDFVEVNIIFSSKNVIDVIMHRVGDQRLMHFTGVYGTSYRGEKDVFWSMMKTKFTPSDIPWLCGGDFNEFLLDHEKSGGMEVLYNRPRYLEDFMHATQLMDLEFNGPFSRGELGDLQKNWDQNLDDIREKTRIVDDLWAQEESYWLRRFRVAWLREGDENTKFFHQSTLHRRRRNKVLKIQDVDGIWVEQPD
ncbi:uncharacterized protein [Malus domestica]|uniref:uncharacterized protein n=1 Tax=Malus domestica TaxID=3750 RepID=UPI003975D39B